MKFFRMRKKSIIYIILLYIIGFSYEYKRKIIYLSEITIIVKGLGNQQILYDSYSPNKIYINEVLQDYNGSFVYNLTDEKNIIKMVWNEPLENCQRMFQGLSNITYIDLSNFNSSKLVYIENMFQDCKSLNSINFKNFDTSKIRNMINIFYNCYSLKSLNLSSFNTSKVTDFHRMFYNCSSLLTLDLYNFDTKNCICIHNIFNGCSNLIYLNLNSFSFSNIQSFDNMFTGCKSLISLNIKNFTSTKFIQSTNIFSNINPNIIFCLENSNNINSEISSNEYKNNCSDICFKADNPRLIIEKNKCIENCLYDLEYPYEFNNICYKSCPLETYISSTNDYLCVESCNYYNYNKTKCFDNIPEGYYLKNIELKIIEKCDIKCRNCSLESLLNNNLCISCNTEKNYYPFYNDYKINNSFIECYNKTPEGAFFNSIENIYQSCYKGCKNCIWSGDIYNNNCSECNSDYELKKNNCLKKCNYYYYFDKIKNEYICTMECPSDSSYLKDNKICAEECSLIELLQKECEIKTNTVIIEDDILLKIRNSLINGSLDDILSSVIQGEDDLVIETNNIIYQIISTNNSNNKNKNISIISLGECENKLKSYYNMSEKESLIIFKIDIYEEGLLIPMINYEVYNANTKKQLNLSICNDENIKINVLLPVYIEENSIYKYNSSDKYYNDECYTYTTEDKTDITITDRKSEFIENNMSLCEANCKYNGYNITIKKAKCECEAKEEISIISEIYQKTEKIMNEFPNLKNATNLKILKCFTTLFTKDGLKLNIGSYILLFIILVTLVCL